MRTRLSVLLIVPALAVGAWYAMTRPGISAQIPDARHAVVRSIQGRSRLVAQTRLSCDIEDLDGLVAEQRGLAERDPSPENLRVLGEALYERILARDMRKGLAIGRFVDAAMYAVNRADIELGLAAVHRARKLGDTSAECDRLEAGLLSQSLTGLGAVFKMRAAIDAALKRALGKDPGNGHVHMALGCRLLFVPSWLGQDIDKAVEHFAFAARVLPNDERPCLFAAFGRYLEGKRDACHEWLEKARQRNPRHPFVAAVLARLAAGEAKPFERDLD